MYYNPLWAFADLLRLTIVFMLLHYVRKIENINCAQLVNGTIPSWKPTYLKFYAVISILFIFVGLFGGSILCKFTQFKIGINCILGILTGIFIWAIFSYVREIEDAFKACHITKLDMDFHLIHEFLKLYSFVMVLLILVFTLLVISIYISYLPIPKYIATQQMFNNSIKHITTKSLKTRATGIKK